MPHRALSVFENLPDQSILQRVSNTPLIRVRLLEKEFPHITFYAKAEWFNPGGSVKDRPALRMIEEAERTGELTVEKVILDSTSGNTGIAYALIGAAKGYQVKLVMPANVNEERREIVKAFGAEAIFTPALEGSDGAIREAHRSAWQKLSRKQITAAVQDAEANGFEKLTAPVVKVVLPSQC